MRKINRLGISLLAFILITALAGIPAVIAGGKKTIGFSSVGRFSLAFIAGEKYLERYSKEQGWDFISAVAENDAAKQAQDIDDLVARGVDLVIIMAVDSNAINSTVRALAADDIPMIGYMRPQDPSAKVLYDAFAGQDTVAQAYDASAAVNGMMAADGLRGKDVRILHVVGDPKDENALLRKKGFEKAAAENGWIIVSEIVCDGWSLDKALTGATNALEADSSINMVMLASDYLWPGVKTALKNKNKLWKRGEKGHVYIASQDLFPVGVDDIEAGYMDASTILDMGGMAITAIEMAKRIFKGEKFTEHTTPKKQNWMAGRTIVRDNLFIEKALWGLEFHPKRKK